MLKFFLSFILLRHYIVCSLVIDSQSQKGVYVSDYCPKMKYCAEGSHVMCMYYNPNRIMGPRCNRPKNVSITPDLANKLLEVSNAVRSKIALGKEKGKGGDYLPKGYGMFRLKWDNELATFAQVLANQCVLRHDMCRATKRFADPGQTAGLVRFTYPDWYPVSKAGHFTKPGLTVSKLAYAITQTLKSWYGQKEAVTPGMITSYPDWAENPNNQGGRLYLEMIYGPATHMGCGISAYTEYAYYDNNAALNYNSIQVICNYSSRPRKGGPVYQVEPPSQVGFTVRCGCPLGMDEDADCLCVESQRNAITASPVGRSCSESGHCKPAVVLLPIFTVENAPPEKLIERSGLDSSPFDRKESEVEIADLYVTTENSSVLHPMERFPQNNIQSIFSNIINEDSPKSDHLTALFANSPMTDTQLPLADLSSQSVRVGYSNLLRKEPRSIISSLPDEIRRNVDLRVSTAHSNPLIRDVQKRIVEKRPTPKLGYFSMNTIHPALNQHQTKKKSVFTNVATFELPKVSNNVIKPDVKPRRDFSAIKDLVNDYLHFRKDNKDPHKIFSNHNFPYEHYGEGLNHKTTTERFLHSAEQKVINYNFMNNDSHPSSQHSKGLFDFEPNVSKQKTNDKLMTLLDKLEQEVKHIELDRSKKEIFDEKIRKIYGSVVGISPPLSYKTDNEKEINDFEISDYDKYKLDHNKHSDSESKILKSKLRHLNEVEDLENNVRNIHDKYSDLENEIRPISRSQNSLYIDKLNRLNHRSVKKAKDGYESHGKNPFSDIEEMKTNTHRGIFNDDNELRNDHVYSENEILRARNVYSGSGDSKKSKYPEKRKFLDEDDPLSVDRRRYFQSKLDNLERKLHSTRSFKHHKDNNNRQVRPVLPTAREEQPLRPSKTQLDPFYMPDRARFLNGF